NNAGKENVAERNIVLDSFRFAGLELQAGNDHPRHPEKNDVGGGDENAGGIKFLSRFLIHRLVSPEPRRKPSVDCVWILDPVFRIGRWMDADINIPIDLGFGIWDLGFPVPSRYSVSPPHLAADAPIADVLQPLRVNFFPMLGKEADKMIAHHSKRFFRFWVAQKPLLTDPWFNRHIAAITEADVVLIRLSLRQRSPRLQQLRGFFSRFEAVQRIQLRNCRTIDASISMQHIHNRQVAALTDL